ncbi:px domain-containing protein [Colletotrichum camelliae]|nr:px domain-containing protein [Colletotrichum camelliae]
MVFNRTPRGGRRGGLMYNNSSYGKSNYSNNRYSRGGYGTGGGGPNTPSSQKKRLDGLYLEGNWYCNCEPRMQAKYLQTKKQGKNHGRYFWTCESRGCNFFLWDDDAKNRAEGNTLTLPPMPEDEATKNGAAMSATAPVPAPVPAIAPAATLPTPTTATPRQRSMGDYLTQQKEAETPSRTAKRKRVLFEFSDDDEDDFGLGDMSSDEERQMTEAMERSAKKLRDTAPATPSSRRVAEGEVDTPGTVSRTLFPDAKRRNTGTGSFSAASTTSSMTANPSMSPPASQTQEEQLDPTDEVMALLKGQEVDEATMGEVRGVLRRYAMKAKGIARGRDSVRSALKTKDEKIAGLQERVASLEDRNRAQREEIADFKASIMDLYSKH